MREIMKRTVAAVMAVLIACAAAGCSSTGNSSSGSSSAGETTTTTAPVVEDMGNLDLSDVTTEYDVPAEAFLWLLLYLRKCSLRYLLSLSTHQNKKLVHCNYHYALFPYSHHLNAPHFFQ